MGMKEFCGGVDRLLELDIGWPAALLTYRTPKYLVIDYWLVGLINRIFQILVVFYVLYTIFSEDSWAYEATPMGLVNAFGSAGASMTTIRALSDYNSPPHCNNATHEFQYSASWVYATPLCKYVVPQQLVNKDKGQVSFTTQYQETEHHGWASSDAQNGTNWAACLSGGGSPHLFMSGQAVCQTTTTVYPLAVEDMVMEFEHTYQLPFAKFGMDKWQGSSGLNAEQANANPKITSPLSTTIKREHGADLTIPDGQPVGMSIRDWLGVAEASLDEHNDVAGVSKAPGEADPQHPFYRMTGLVVLVNIAYVNGEPTIGENKGVNAVVTATKQLVAWAGPGSDRIHIEFPSGAPGSESFRYIDRYGQGIVFQFEATGTVYKFDTVHFVNTLVLGFVMLSLAATLTDFIAFYCLPNGHSAMLKPHRAMKISKKQAFAELGVKTALSAMAFSSFDPDKNLRIEATDIVHMLAGVVPPGDDDEASGLNAERAYAIALAILTGTDKDGSMTMDFKEYMTTQDNGSIDYAQYLKYLKVPEDMEEDPAVMAAVHKAFDEGRTRPRGASVKEDSLTAAMRTVVAKRRGGAAASRTPKTENFANDVLNTVND